QAASSFRRPCVILCASVAPTECTLDIFPVIPRRTAVSVYRKKSRRRFSMPSRSERRSQFLARPRGANIRTDSRVAIASPIHGLSQDLVQDSIRGTTRGSRIRGGGEQPVGW